MKAHESHTQAAQMCRAEGWAAGDVLIGRDHPDDPDRYAIRLTAVGMHQVLAVRLSDFRYGRWHARPDRYEAIFGVLAKRQWRKATAAEAAEVENPRATPFDAAEGV